MKKLLYRFVPLISVFTCALFALAPAQAFAQVTTQTVTVTPNYSNPATGQIEDSGGKNNRALGESMVVSTTDSSGLLESGDNGITYLTLRFHLADQIKGLSAETSSDGGSTFSTTEVVKTGEDLSHGDASQDNTVDYRLKVPSNDAVVRLKLDVIPMGREVTYFVTFGNAVEGNTAGFTQSSFEDLSSSNADSARDSSDGSTEDSLNKESGTDADGISAYDADGNKVGDSTEPISGIMLAAIVGGIVCVLGAIGAVYYVAVIRPRKSYAAAAAAAASGSESDSIQSSEKNLDIEPQDDPASATSNKA